MYKIEFPITEFNGDVTSNLQDIRSYLYKLAEGLNYSINHLGTDNFVPELRKSINLAENVRIRMDELNAVQRDELEAKVRWLADEIKTQAQSIAIGVMSDFRVDDDQISQVVAREAVTRAEMTNDDGSEFTGTLTSFISSKLQTTAHSISALFDQTERLETTLGDNYNSEIFSWIRLTADPAIEIGSTDTNNSVKIDTGGLHLLDAGTEVAKITQNTLLISSAEIENKIKIGPILFTSLGSGTYRRLEGTWVG